MEKLLLVAMVVAAATLPALVVGQEEEVEAFDPNDDFKFEMRKPKVLVKGHVVCDRCWHGRVGNTSIPLHDAEVGIKCVDLYGFVTFSGVGYTNTHGVFTIPMDEIPAIFGIKGCKAKLLRGPGYGDCDEVSSMGDGYTGAPLLLVHKSLREVVFTSGPFACRPQKRPGLCKSTTAPPLPPPPVYNKYSSPPPPLKHVPNYHPSPPSVPSYHSHTPPPVFHRPPPPPPRPVAPPVSKSPPPPFNPYIYKSPPPPAPAVKYHHPPPPAPIHFRKTPPPQIHPSPPPVTPHKYPPPMQPRKPSPPPPVLPKPAPPVLPKPPPPVLPKPSPGPGTKLPPPHFYNSPPPPPYHNRSPPPVPAKSPVPVPPPHAYKYSSPPPPPKTITWDWTDR